MNIKRSMVKLLMVYGISIAVIGVIGVSVYNIFIMESQRNVNILRTQVAGEIEKKRELEVNLEAVKNPEFILQRAQEMGMVASSDVTYIPNTGTP